MLEDLDKFNKSLKLNHLRIVYNCRFQDNLLIKKAVKLVEFFPNLKEFSLEVDFETVERLVRDFGKTQGFKFFIRIVVKLPIFQFIQK